MTGSDSKKTIIVIVLILLSTFIGFYNRVEKKDIPVSTVNVIQKSDSVLVIPIEGLIMFGSKEWKNSITDIVSEQLKIAEKSKSIKAVVLRINSPGGTIGASQDIYDTITRFREKTKKPVVASILDVGASGGYWIALASDRIFSYPGSIVGSIGVITQTMDFTSVPKKYGIGTRTYKSVKHKDLLNAWRKPIKSELVLINNMLSTVHSQFRGVVKNRRNFSEKKIRTITDGRIYAGQDALTEGLVDELGSLYDAIQYAAKASGIDGEPKVIYPMRGIKDWVQSFRLSLSPTSFAQGLLFNQSIQSMN